METANIDFTVRKGGLPGVCEQREFTGGYGQNQSGTMVYHQEKPPRSQR